MSLILMDFDIALIGEYANHLFGRKQNLKLARTMKELYGKTKKAGLIIAHTGYILEYVNADVGHVLVQVE